MAVYKRNIVDIELEQGQIHRAFLNQSIGYMDQKADHFGVRVFRNDEPVNLTGISVQGVFMPPQGSPIAITSGNIVSGNEAEVVLPQACYNYDGQFTLAIKLVDPSNSVTGTVRIVDGMVDNTHASGTVAPTAAVPGYEEVLATYEQAIAAINKTVRFDATQSLTDTQKATARSNISAPSVAEMNTAVGNEATARQNADALKVNISDIENDLTGTTAGKVLDARQGKVLDDKVSDVKSAITSIENNSYMSTNRFDNLVTIGKGSLVNSAGRPGTDSGNLWVDLPYGSTKTLFIYAGSKITVKTGYVMSYSLWTMPVTSSVSADYRIAMGRGLAAGTVISIEKDCYIFLAVKKADDTQIAVDEDLAAFMAAAVEITINYSVPETEITNIYNEIDDVRNKAKMTCSLNNRFVDKFSISDNESVGSTVDPTPSASSAFSYLIYPCKKGDVFTLTGGGGSSARLWVFTDNTYKLLSKSSSNATATAETIEAPSDGYIIINTYTASTHSLSITREGIVVDNELNISGAAADAKAVGEWFSSNVNEMITDPKELRWLFGTHSSSGTITQSNNGLTLEMPIYVENALITQDGTLDIQSRFRPEGGDATYATWSQTGRQFTVPGRLQFSVRYHNGDKCNDISILNHVFINIKMRKEKVLDVDYKAIDIMYGMIPTNDYTGKHTDNTGFTRTTVYSDAIAKWRELPTLAPGYITETDLGEAYEGGAHTFKYTLIPPNQEKSKKHLPHVMIITSQHGHEKSATYGLYYLIRDMLDHPTDDPVLFYLRNYVKFTILPMANPCGWDAGDSHEGNRYNENGINLNRNYSTSVWDNFDDDETYTQPWQYNSRGSEPFSEPETQRIRDEVIAADNLSLLIDIHTNGLDTQARDEIAYCSIAWEDKDVFNEALTAADQWIGGMKVHMDSLYGTDLGNYVYGSCNKQGGVDNLTVKDWGYESRRVLSTTLEVLNGTRTTDYLGERLRQYTPDCIKLCGEEIGNFLIKMLYHIQK